MIAATQRWWKRNRTNILVGAGVIGAGYLAGQYALNRFAESRQRSKDEKASKENLEIRFRANQQDCTYTVLALLPTIRDEIISALPVEEITDQLQHERQERLKRLAASEAASSEYPSAPPSTVDDASTASFIHASQTSSTDQPLRPKRSKAQLWQDMKINSIARALALLYTLALLNILTRIQLNLLGRRTYLSSVVALASPMDSSTISLEDKDADVYGTDFETNRLYLTFSWWILHRGAKSILERVMVAVKDVFNQVNIREDMSLERLSELIIEVRRRVEGATEEERRRMSWLQYLLPPREQELFVIQQAGMSDGSDSASPEPAQVPNPLESGSISPSLRRLLDETSDLIDSPTFSVVLSHLLDAGFSHLVDVRIASEAFKTSLPMEGSRITELPDLKCKLAHILPVFCRQAHSIVVGSGELDAIAGVAGNQAVPNEYLAVMDHVHDLEAFAAVIYSSNFEYEAVESPRMEFSQVQPSVISLSESQPLTLSEIESVHVPSQIIQAPSNPVTSTDPLAESAIQIQREDAQPTQSSLNTLTESAIQVQPPSQTTTDILGESADQVQAPSQAVADNLGESAVQVQPPVPSSADALTQRAAQLPPSQTRADTLAEIAVEIQRPSQPPQQTMTESVQAPRAQIPLPQQSGPDFDSAWTEALAKGSKLKPAIQEKPEDA